MHFPKNNYSIDDRGYNRLADKLDQATADFQISKFATHMAYYDKAQLFAEYVKTRCERNVTFKVNYVFGERFMNEFISDMEVERTLIKAQNYTSARQQERASWGFA